MLEIYFQAYFLSVATVSYGVAQPSHLTVVDYSSPGRCGSVSYWEPTCYVF